MGLQPVLLKCSQDLHFHVNLGMLSRLTYTAPKHYNIQGSKNVTVTDGFVRTWDDSLVVKDNDNLSCENIVFNGVNVWTDLAQSMEVGFETHGEYIKDVTFENITVFHNYHKAVMSIHNADIADISNITYRNITLEDGQMLGDNRGDGVDDYLIDFSIEYSIEWSESTDLGNVSNITVENINVIKMEDSIISRISGYAGNHATISNINLNNITIAGNNVSSKNDLKLVIGTDVDESSIHIKSGTASGSPKKISYDLSDLDETKITLDNKEMVKQEAVKVPEFSYMVGDLPYMGEPTALNIKSASITYGKGNKFNTPISDSDTEGSDDFQNADYPSTNLFDESYTTHFESKDYLEQENEFVGLTFELNEMVNVGTLRLKANSDNSYSYTYGIQVRGKPKNDASSAYVILSSTNYYTFTPTKGNIIDISFQASDLYGIQLRVFRYSNTLFDLGKLVLNEIEVYGASLSYKKPVVDASDYHDVYDSSRITDGNPDGTSYYESEGFPAHLVIDLQAVYLVKAITLRLPGSFNWNIRTQEIQLSASAVDSAYSSNIEFTAFVEKREMTFDPSTGNQVLLSLSTPVSMRFLKIDIFSNDIPSKYGAQLSEVYVFGTK